VLLAGGVVNGAIRQAAKRAQKMLEDEKVDAAPAAAGKDEKNAKGDK
jgi:hypothetical protein